METPDSTEMSARGHNGTMLFDGAFVTIQRKGFLARSTVGKGNKRIPVSSIAAIQVKPPGAMVNGFVQLTVAGGNERRSKLGRQTIDAMSDENSIVVTKKQFKSFEPLINAIESAITQNQRSFISNDAPNATASAADEIKKLAELRESGALSETEFETLKARLI
ncbi:DUF4429 domain-containing protein [Candidatus Poriferisodalis sp.]|uniref:DUF4429 domain-containing protein n=1 Tax=Candidatus Poriferisodalis sp. TaxID=3101277 RepID=UPI003C6F4E2B